MKLTMTLKEKYNNGFSNLKYIFELTTPEGNKTITYLDTDYNYEKTFVRSLAKFMGYKTVKSLKEGMSFELDFVLVKKAITKPSQVLFLITELEKTISFKREDFSLTELEIL